MFLRNMRFKPLRIVFNFCAKNCFSSTYISEPCMHVDLGCSFNVAFTSVPRFASFVKKQEIFVLDANENLDKCRMHVFRKLCYDIF